MMKIILILLLLTMNISGIYRRSRFRTYYYRHNYSSSSVNTPNWVYYVMFGVILVSILIAIACAIHTHYKNQPSSNNTQEGPPEYHNIQNPQNNYQGNYQGRYQAYPQQNPNYSNYPNYPP